MQTGKNHTAWRWLGVRLAYVESICQKGEGDKYSYTSDANKALLMSERECKAFCKYMHECATVGFWS